MSWFKKVALLLLVVLTLVTVAQNTEVVTLRFLIWEIEMSRILLLSLAVLTGLLIGFLVAKLPGRQPRI